MAKVQGREIHPPHDFVGIGGRASSCPILPQFRQRTRSGTWWLRECRPATNPKSIMW